jgi:hypothetical protein
MDRVEQDQNTMLNRLGIAAARLNRSLSLELFQ